MRDWSEHDAAIERAFGIKVGKNGVVEDKADSGYAAFVLLCLAVTFLAGAAIGAALFRIARMLG